MVGELKDRGIIARAVVDSIVFCPAMTITEAELDEIFGAVGPALDATLDWAKAEGHI
jgi:4-aminobutyrate--pyruvate transaminase